MEIFFDLRDSVNEMVKNCSNNVQIAIYINHILDQPVVINRGNIENRIRITIKSNGEVTHNWTKETWAKKLWDWFYGFFGLMEKLGKLLVTVLELTKKAVGFSAYGEVAYGVIKAICDNKSAG